MSISDIRRINNPLRETRTCRHGTPKPNPGNKHGIFTFVIIITLVLLILLDYRFSLPSTHRLGYLSTLALHLIHTLLCGAF